MPRTSRTIAALLLVTLLAAGQADAQEADAAVTWGVRPADTEQGSERPNYAYALDPGGQLSDALIVSNYDDEPQTFRVYGADGFITEAGQLDLLPAAKPSTQLGSWISFEAPEVTVPAGESVQVPFELVVPDDVTPGDYAAGVVSSILVEGETGVSVDRRLGSRMYLRVGGDLVPRLSIDGLAVSYDGGWNPFAPGSATVDYTVTNAGNTRIAPGAEISVAGLLGLAPVSATDPEPLPELLPGTSVSRTLTVAGVWPLFVATARAALSGTVVTADQAAQADSAVVIPNVPVATAESTAAAMPWSALLLLALLIGLVVLTVVRRRRRAAGEQARIDAAVAAALSAQPEAADRAEAGS
ncbi:hypothetical protein [Rathayibacter rathayi]|uniref:hypothetical protein n=1 Tax=Rathayibacter rathayi TaxID=33887 RepID=UPI000CE83D5F|nr:hypothetical protein [Rathayibacter rathayi]PPG65572.1 hypothetical protein C5C02_13425 [Rathayibacter rathayi]PPG75701.1 hypothetical protein C5C23_09820 [Rathayibacter rathayi]PPI78205.1 hypothetical protein C5E03_00255 [Rathayibacter rathayi]